MDFGQASQQCCLLRDGHTDLGYTRKDAEAGPALEKVHAGQESGAWRAEKIAQFLPGSDWPILVNVYEILQVPNLRNIKDGVRVHAIGAASLERGISPHAKPPTFSP